MQNYTSSQKLGGLGGTFYTINHIRMWNLIRKSPGTHERKMRGGGE